MPISIVTSLPSADPLGIVDQRQGAWAESLIAGIGFRLDQFVPIVAAGTRIGAVSAQAAAETGLRAGTPVVAGGKKLLVNAVIRPGGEVRVAIADGQDKVFDGFGKDDCVAFSGDSVAHDVQWEKRTELPTATFKKLHFYLKDADLFSFQFV